MTRFDRIAKTSTKITAITPKYIQVIATLTPYIPRPQAVLKISSTKLLPGAVNESTMIYTMLVKNRGEINGKVIFQKFPNQWRLQFLHIHRVKMEFPANRTKILELVLLKH